MANPKGNPDIKKYGAKTRFGMPDGCSAVEANARSREAQLQGKRITHDLMEQSTPELISEANKRLLQAVKHGNLKAYEIWAAMMGEKPQDNVRITTQADDMAKMDDILRQMGMIDEQSDPVSEV